VVPVEWAGWTSYHSFLTCLAVGAGSRRLLPNVNARRIWDLRCSSESRFLGDHIVFVGLDQ